MGVFDFVKEAGAKVGIGESKAEKQEKEVAAASAKAAKEAAQRARKAAAERGKRIEERKAEKLDESKKAAGLEMYVQNMGLEIKNLDIRFDDGLATISGEAKDQATRERAILAVGNTQDVGQVHDDITVPAAAKQESVMHVVESGDTLWKIAEEHYKDGSKYPAIFEANKPMLTDPDLIFPGQVLRIPAD